MYPVSFGAVTQLFAATASAAADMNGKVSLLSRFPDHSSVEHQPFLLSVSGSLGSHRKTSIEGRGSTRRSSALGMVRSAGDISAFKPPSKLKIATVNEEMSKFSKS
jgi:hypothetical protein